MNSDPSSTSSAAEGRSSGVRTVKRELIMEQLRSEVLSGVLPRGTHMRQDELARRFDSSITPVREALRLLEAEGLVVSEPHRGVRVAGVDEEQVKATYVARRLLEVYAMQRASIRISPHDLQRLEAIIERMERAGAESDSRTYRAENHAFHFYFYERCGLPGLVELISTLWRSFPWDLMLSTPERAHESSVEHRQMLDAVRSGDLDEVTRATEEHILRGFEGISRRIGTESMRLSPDPFLLDAE